MQFEKQIDVNGRTVTVKEISVKDILQMLKEDEQRYEASVSGLYPNKVEQIVDFALFDYVALPDLMKMTDLSMDDINTMRPSELARVVEAVKEVNPHFFALADKLIRIWQSLENRLSASPATSAP